MKLISIFFSSSTQNTVYFQKNVFEKKHSDYSTPFTVFGILPEFGYYNRYMLDTRFSEKKNLIAGIVNYTFIKCIIKN